MLIGIDASKINSKQKTGTEWYTYFLVKNIIKQAKNIEHKFVLYSKEPLLFDLPNNFENKVLKWPFKKLWYQGRLSLEMLFLKPDVLFVPAHTIPLIHPKKTITTCHDVGFQKHPELYSKKELKYHRFSMKFAVKNAHKILTVSSFSKKELLNSYNISEDKIKVIYISYNKELYNTNVIKQKQEDTYLLYIGRLEEKKNTKNLIKAFEILKQKYNIKQNLLLIGNWGTGKNEIKEIINKSQYKDNIKTPGFVSEDQIPQILANADVFVFPSLYEGFGIPLLQAIAVKTPICASKKASIPEIGMDAVNYFDPFDENDIAEKIYQVLENKNNIRDTIIQAGLNRINDFSWEKCAEQTLREIIL